MKHSHLLSLLQTDFYTVGVIFPEHPGYNDDWTDKSNREEFYRTITDGKTKVYTYKSKEFLSIGDFAVVDSPSTGFTVVKVIRKDETPTIDVNASFDYKWIVQRVDTDWYNQNLKNEHAFLQAMKKAERIRQREEAIIKLQESMPEGSYSRSILDNALKEAAIKLGDD